MPKYPEMAFTARGLRYKGYPSEARQLMEFGVRPSIFGMAQLIDFVLLLDGKDYLSGLSH